MLTLLTNYKFEKKVEVKIKLRKLRKLYTPRRLDECLTSDAIKYFLFFFILYFIS
jgi:hypothetical protein